MFLLDKKLFKNRYPLILLQNHNETFLVIASMVYSRFFIVLPSYVFQSFGNGKCSRNMLKLDFAENCYPSYLYTDVTCETLVFLYFFFPLSFCLSCNMGIIFLFICIEFSAVYGLFSCIKEKTEVGQERSFERKSTMVGLFRQVPQPTIEGIRALAITRK